MSVNGTSVPGSSLWGAAHILIPPQPDLAGVTTLVCEELHRCWANAASLPSWADIEAELETAQAHVLVNENSPTIVQERGLKGLLKKLLIKCVLRFARPITRSQGRFNSLMLECVDGLRARTHAKEKGLSLLDRIVHLEAQLANQEAQLCELKEMLLLSPLRRAS